MLIADASHGDWIKAERDFALVTTNTLPLSAPLQCVKRQKSFTNFNNERRVIR